MAAHKHDHNTCLTDAVQKAEVLCGELGVQLTPIRKKVLELVWLNHKAVKAYDLLEKLDTKDGAIAPPTVYRALDFLVKNGLVHKIESLNAFVGCSHPFDKHNCQFFICTDCGDVSEFCDPDVTKLLQKNARKKGFAFKRQMLEAYGTCANCQK